MMMTDKEVLDLVSLCCFDEFNADDDPWEVLQPIVEAIGSDAFYYNSGATKTVLIFKNYPYAVKIPFCGHYVDSEHYNEETEEWEYDEEQFEEFQGARCESNHWNYCQAEAELYEEAVIDGMDELFAETRLLGFAKDHPIYIQPFCVALEDETSKSHHTSEECASTAKTCKENGLHCFNEEWLTDVVNSFGEQTMLDLLRFIQQECISDLHDGNIGYKNGVPCIFDYSGYDED